MYYFDNAATGFPKSEYVFNAMKEAFYESGNAGRSGHDAAIKGSLILYNCRKKSGDLFGCEPEQVVLTKNATEALNLAIKGVITKKTVKKGEVLISSLEHNSVLRPVLSLCSSDKMTKKQFEVDLYDDDKTVENFEKALGKKTVLAVVTHASNVCGRILPVKRLISLAKENDTVFILDASQTAGHFPFTIEELGADIICIPGHKGLYGPMGTGLMIVSPKSKLSFRTIMEGGSGTGSLDYGMPKLLPERLEYGTQNNCGFAGLTASIEELVFPVHLCKLFEYLLEKMRARENILLFGEPKDNTYDYVPVLLFNKKNALCEELAAYLNEKGISVRAGYHCAPLAHNALGTIKTGGVRISLGRSNTSEDIDYLMSVL
ncbi:MAG: aminotransferase class V-fold PLP-dependent enzyme [Eubacteriales bacterium]|nr:aminotransferase class V-fold PLP-dependent enzyme [Eubacteriales bacterium]MDD4421824.1 aminotransferase class V-fold PLP-dependent enzyme [Eubacteriales bacterium]